MLVRFADKKIARLETDPSYSAGFGPNIVKAFRKVMPIIRSALDERDFYALKSLHYEKLKGNRSHQRSMRLNQQFRLIVGLEQEPGGERAVAIISIEDYH